MSQCSLIVVRFSVSHERSNRRFNIKYFLLCVKEIMKQLISQLGTNHTS